jgi:hypothetical protein
MVALTGEKMVKAMGVYSAASMVHKRASCMVVLRVGGMDLPLEKY